jgi:hypothetical protein
MPDRRKPPVDTGSRPGSRPDGSPLPDDSFSFSIETTTMRLKSLRLRRAEAESMEVDAAVKAAISRDQARDSRDSVDMPSGGPAGRVRHDARGHAVWDWAVATGEFATLSTSRALKKLEVADLQIEDHKPAPLKVETTGRDKAGGFDPYNQRGSGKRQGEAAQRAGVTGSPARGGPVLDQLTGKKK